MADEYPPKMEPRFTTRMARRVTDTGEILPNDDESTNKLVDAAEDAMRQLMVEWRDSTSGEMGAMLTAAINVTLDLLQRAPQRVQVNYAQGIVLLLSERVPDAVFVSHVAPARAAQRSEFN